jgi:hypothetical protein
MRGFVQLTEDEKRRAIEVRQHVLADHAEWPPALVQTINELVAGAERGGLVRQSLGVIKHIRRLVLDYFKPQAARDAQSAIYPDANELVIVLMANTQIIAENGGNLSHESEMILDRRAREAAEKAVLGDEQQQ